MKLPEEFRKYFWDTKFDELDTEKNKRFIISRLYCYGDLKEVDWIESTYSDEEIEEVAKKSRNFTPLVANYLRQKYNLEKSEMAYYRNCKDLNYEFRRVKI